jgi:diacylglycerol kinase
MFTGLSTVEWCLILFSIALVLSLEMVNTAIERVCNMQTTEFHPAIKVIKDVAAAAVLLSSVIAAIIGMLVFIPHIRYYLFH